MWLHSCHYTTPIHLCVGEIIFLKSSILTGQKGSEKLADTEQNSSEVQSQERGPPAVSGGQEKRREKVPSPSSEETYPFYQPAEEAPETPDRVECQDSGGARTTIDLAALTRLPSKEEERLSDSPPAVPDASTQHPSDLCHEQQTIENSRGAEEESGESPEAGEAAVVECIVTEENTDVIISSTAVAFESSAEEQEDVQSSQEGELSDETDVCVHQGV